MASRSRNSDKKDEYTKDPDKRKAEELADKGSLAERLASERKRKKKRLDEIMGK